MVGETMAAKIRKEEKGYWILIILVIISLLLLLFLYDTHKRKKTSPSETIVAANPVDLAAALAELDHLRKQAEFVWPVAKRPEGLQLVEHRAFSLGYSEEHEQAAWVGYLLSRQHAENRYKRRNNFKDDPLVRSGSASRQDYTRSGYDRGHLAPAADLDFSRQALDESFYMSNISPQHPSFNRGGWKELEERVRQWALKEDSLWVVSGPVLQPGLQKIGINQVSVPAHFYKIILDSRQTELKIISFLLPNRKIERDLSYWVVPVDSVEALSGLDFFPQLPDVLEDSLESALQTELWFKKD